MTASRRSWRRLQHRVESACQRWVSTVPTLVFPSPSNSRCGTASSTLELEVAAEWMVDRRPGCLTWSMSGMPLGKFGEWRTEMTSSGLGFLSQNAGMVFYNTYGSMWRPKWRGMCKYFAASRDVRSAVRRSGRCPSLSCP